MEIYSRYSLYICQERRFFDSLRFLFHPKIILISLGILGDRLLAKGDEDSAILCFICAGNVEKSVDLWVKEIQKGKQMQLALQSFVEKVSLFEQAIEQQGPFKGILAKKFRFERFYSFLDTSLSEYAEILAGQGRVSVAFQYLSNCVLDDVEDKENESILLDRLYHAQKVFHFKFQQR